MTEYKNLDICLVCGADDLIVHCDLGMQPLANNLKNSPLEEDQKFPIVVNVCPKCTHKQLSISVDRNMLFSSYLYKTGVSKKHLEFFVSFAKFTNMYFGNKSGHSILDIGCNDGSLLECFKILKWVVVGIEPCKDLAIEASIEKDIAILSDFFPTKEPMGPFDCITAFNVFAHNNDPMTFLCEMSKLLKEDGRIYILTTRAFLDNFYHEHISYFTPLSMIRLADQCGLSVTNFKEVSMHGKSYLFELAKVKKESELNKEVLGNLIRNDRPVIGYGASANGTVILNYLNIAPEYVIDDNPLKQGKFIPGVNVPIYNNNHLVFDKRDLNIIILAYHLFDEISAKIKELRPKAKDIFIHPIKGVVS